MSVYTYGTRNHTLGDKVYEGMILFRSKVPELDGNIDSVVLSLEKNAPSSGRAPSTPIGA